MHRFSLTSTITAIALVLSLTTTAGSAQDLTQLSIEQLLNREITSVAKSNQKFADAAAAVFVLSADDIRRSGITVLPEALRLVPGLQVARLSSNRWAISARGFNGRFATKLLVLIDGRSVYTPNFSGVYWEGLDLPLADIERIEVIRGPGASLWGANAVNGIINIITRPAADTVGGQASVTVGDSDDIVDLRYGVRLSENTELRTSGRYTRRDGLPGPDRDAGTPNSGDDWTTRRSQFRLDWRPHAIDALSLQGDYVNIDARRRFGVPGEPTAVLDRGILQERSLAARWERTFSLASRMALQLYYQSEQRDDLFVDYRQSITDIDFQHEFAPTEEQVLTWGLAYRTTRDNYDTAELFNTQPRRRHQKLFSAFVQHQTQLFDERLTLTLGSKLEHHSFSGWEHQPNARLLWKPAPKQRLWASLARAARVPSRSEYDASEIDIFQIPNTNTGTPQFVVYRGNPQFDSEKVVSFELGYRSWPIEGLFIDIAAFFNRYKNLRSSELGDPELDTNRARVVLPFKVVNAERGDTYGIELAADWRPTANWRLQLSYSFLRSQFRIDQRFANAELFPQNYGDRRSPRHQATLRSSLDLPHNIELDLTLRYVDNIDDIQAASPLPDNSIDDYLALDLRLGWRPSEHFELSLGARNLGSRHMEFLQEISTAPQQVERQIYGQLTWRF